MMMGEKCYCGDCVQRRTLWWTLLIMSVVITPFVFIATW